MTTKTVKSDNLKPYMLFSVVLKEKYLNHFFSSCYLLFREAMMKYNPYEQSRNVIQYVLSGKQVKSILGTCLKKLVTPSVKGDEIMTNSLRFKVQPYELVSN